MPSQSIKQNHLIEIVTGEHDLYVITCSIQSPAGKEIKVQDKVFKQNYYGSLKQKILSGILDKSVFTFKIIDPKKKGLEKMTIVKAKYDSESYEFKRIYYKDRDFISFYGCFKMIECTNKDLVKITKNI